MWTNIEGAENLYGAYVYASYFLTGEHRNYNRTLGRFERVTPFENFWIVPGCYGRGAWEAAVRWSYVDAKALNQGSLQDLTFAMNWYLTPHTRMMFEWIHPYGSDADGVVGNNPEADILGTRVQWDF
jgi:phosphate-selective porin OprO/OprP